MHRRPCVQDVRQGFRRPAEPRKGALHALPAHLPAMNEYEVLNIPVTATPEEIRAAYRNLARRWHPDRFMAGPERDWANEKMAAINAAYRTCLNGARQSVKPSADGEHEALMQVQALIDDGKYQSARKLLMGFDTRCAEWNFICRYPFVAEQLILYPLTLCVIIRIAFAGYQNKQSVATLLVLVLASWPATPLATGYFNILLPQLNTRP